MREKVNTAYFLNDPRKFASTEDGEKELNRLRAVCMRWKKKQTEDISITLGLSATSTEFVGKMGYVRYRGRNQAGQYSFARKSVRLQVLSEAREQTGSA